MIRMRLPFLRTPLRLRGIAKWQIAGAIVIGFMVGYFLLPYFSTKAPDSYYAPNVGGRDGVHKFGLPPKRGPGWQEQVMEGEKFWEDLQMKRVRERGIYFDDAGQHFIIEGKKKLILSGAIHYFRVVPAYWEDRLIRLMAAGLNTVETYVPWNLHEPIPGQYDFAGILDLVEFINTAGRLGLHVIVRPGPYICAEWEMGGLPGWLLHYDGIRVRTMDRNYLSAVEPYMKRLYELLVPLQSSFGGPIIAFQIENEYGGFALSPEDYSEGKQYMYYLFQIAREMGVVELLFVSDGAVYFNNTLGVHPSQEVLITVNFMNERGALSTLHKIQPKKPRMIMEWWSGWFDHWTEHHLTRNQDPVEMGQNLEKFIKQNVSVNFYMFHGGTNFGFMNGGNWNPDFPDQYQPTITSYDYDAPVSECGDLTEKYINIRTAITEHAPDSMAVNPLPPLPGNLPKRAYDQTRLTLYIPITSTLQYLPSPYINDHPVTMEMLAVNKGWGQSYGYVLYQTKLSSKSKRVAIHGLKDYGIAMVNSKPVKRLTSFGMEAFTIPDSETAPGEDISLDILVENAGRVNFGHPLENRKGISGKVMVDDRDHTHWKIYSLEFKNSFIENIDSGGMWVRTPSPSAPGPALFKGTFTIRGPVCDTFLDMKGWGKGIVIVNGANIGRYWSVGPQRTLYIPAPLLKDGVNKVMIFELHQPKSPQTLVFTDSAILDSQRPLVTL